MKESAERTKILEYVRSATANTNTNPRRNASMGLSKLKQSQKLNPEVDVLYSESNNGLVNDNKSGRSKQDILFLNNRAIFTNIPSK